MTYFKENNPNKEESQLDSETTIMIGGREYGKHIPHWFEDGNVGFLVGGTAFLVHRGVISRKSSVMKTLISSSSAKDFKDTVPPYEQPHGITLNGVPFIKLGPDDRAIDLAQVLDFIYPDSLPFSNTALSDLTVRDLMSFVRFTNKYLISDLKRWAVAKLEAIHLITPLDRWVMDALTERYLKNPDLCVDIIQFALDCRLPRFLPLAFYALATLDWSEQPEGASQCLERLSPANRCRLLEGRSALTKAVKVNDLDVYENVEADDRCPNGKVECNRVWSKLWPNPQERWVNLLLHPLEELELVTATAEREGWKGLCLECFQVLQAETRGFRDDLIGQLNIFFRLEQ
ncbi:hypothetical protein FRB90_009611 [Tulasnella sp. 427]|nr:hypothetical protein FRB90_009611 [Tulasnella sp. 427]